MWLLRWRFYKTLRVLLSIIPAVNAPSTTHAKCPMQLLNRQLHRGFPNRSHGEHGGFDEGGTAQPLKHL